MANEFNCVADVTIFAFNAHRGQVDKGGNEYWLHPQAVAGLVEDWGGDDVAIKAAWLHDVVEDTDISLATIKWAFGEEVANVVRLVSKNHNKDLTLIKADPRARLVKVADLMHNSDLTRLPVVTERDRRRTAEYQKRIKYLLD